MESWGNMLKPSKYPLWCDSLILWSLMCWRGECEDGLRKMWMSLDYWPRWYPVTLKEEIVVSLPLPYVWGWKSLLCLERRLPLPWWNDLGISKKMFARQCQTQQPYCLARWNVFCVAFLVLPIWSLHMFVWWGSTGSSSHEFVWWWNASWHKFVWWWNVENLLPTEE